MWRRSRPEDDSLYSPEWSSRPSNLPPPPASSKETGSSSPKGQLFRQFTIEEIQSATQNFEMVIRTGRSGNVYKGTIKNGTTTTIVAVKQYTSDFLRFPQLFQAKVKFVSMLQHPNIVCLIGYCTVDRFVVFEYMSNGSLEDHLHKHHTPLSWSQRLKICIDVARALDYLHNGSGKNVLHSSLKSSKILLDYQWAAKIADSGFSTIIPFNNPNMDPKFMATGRLSKKSDVYSFGVVLLEVLCRRSIVDRNLDEEHKGLVRWAQDGVRRGNLYQIIDPELKGQISRAYLNRYAKIVEGCLRESQEQRVTMAEVVSGLESMLASHERTNSSIPQMGITASDGRLHKYFSGGRYLSKVTRPLSAKSLQHKGDHGQTDANAISEESHHKQKSLKQKVRFSVEDFDQASEPNREVIDESFYGLTLAEYVKRAGELKRMKDFLHLIWFYPMQKEAELHFGSLLYKFSSLNHYIGKSLATSGDEDYLMEIQTLLQDIEEHLDDVSFDIVAYLPDGLVEKRSGFIGLKNLATGINTGQVPFTSFWSRIPEVHTRAVASATHRAISCIKDLKVMKLGISGSGAQKVVETLKDMPELRRAFDMVLCVRVKHHSIEVLMDDIQQEIYMWIDRSSETGNKIAVLDKFRNCLLFVDCSEDYIDLYGPKFDLSRWFGTVQIVMTSGSQNTYCPMDMEIRVEDEVLPWILFSRNVDLATVSNYNSIKEMTTRIIEKCHGHLLAIILLARALRHKVDVGVWELALQELDSQVEPSSSSQLGVTSDVMVRVLGFIWPRMETLSQRCIIQFASRYAEFDESSLISSWTGDGLVISEEEGEQVFQGLIRSFLLERCGEYSVRMRDETRVILLAYFAPRAYGLYLKQDGSESNRMPNVEEWDAREIHLSNNIISKLPDNPKCPILVSLFLHFNQDLTDIPFTFFDNMPSIQVLDLSSTSIKCLPSSISKLTTLGKLFIRDCVLLMELPPEIGALKNLKVFDSEGTQLVCLPEQFGSLTKLECLKFSLYNFSDRHKRSNESMQIIPTADLSKLRRLKEITIFVNSYSEWWEEEAKLIIGILPKVQNLESLKLYFPTTELLEIFMETQNWRGIPIYQCLLNFGFVVGHLQKRPIYRVPRDLEKAFVKLTKSLKYTNGKGDTKVIARVLEHANALFLDRHWTARSLSSFGLAEMEKLKFCLLAECNEMLEVVDGSHLEDSSRRPVLGSLEHLSVHYMTSLTCILNGRVPSVCLSNLKTLAMHSCPELRTIFTQGLLNSLTCLEYLIVEDCTRIESLVSLESNHSTSTPSLPSLKKISLLDLPELVSICHGTSIATGLESLVVYDCPNLEKLPYMEDSDHIREIKGEIEWWDALKWCEPEWTSGQPDYLAKVFIPLGTDIMDELDDAVNLLPHYK